MSTKRVRVDLTPAQLRMVNAALAREEAEDHDPVTDGYSQPLMDRTRHAVWEAMEREGVDP